MQVNENSYRDSFDEFEIKVLHFFKATIEGILWSILAVIIYHKFDIAVEFITHINSWHVDNLHCPAYVFYFLFTLVTFFLVHFTSLALLKLVLRFRK